MWVTVVALSFILDPPAFAVVLGMHNMGNSGRFVSLYSCVASKHQSPGRPNPEPKCETLDPNPPTTTYPPGLKRGGLPRLRFSQTRSIQAYDNLYTALLRFPCLTEYQSVPGRRDNVIVMQTEQKQYSLQHVLLETTLWNCWVGYKHVQE